MPSLLPLLQEAAAGLVFISETDAPLEPFELAPGTSAESPETFLTAMGLGADQPVETVTLAHFFRNMVRTYPDQAPAEKESADRFKALQGWLEANLQDVVVYRVGQVQVQAYVVGKAPDQTWLGLKTTLVET